MEATLKTLVFLTLLFPCTSFADLDAASSQALDQTQNLLQSESQRDKAIQADPKAKAADDKALEVGGSAANQQKMYDISSDIFQSMVKQSGGDVEAQKAMMDKAASDPEGFYNSLTPEQKAQISALANQIQTRNPAATSQP